MPAAPAALYRSYPYTKIYRSRTRRATIYNAPRFVGALRCTRRAAIRRGEISIRYRRPSFSEHETQPLLAKTVAHGRTETRAVSFGNTITLDTTRSAIYNALRFIGAIRRTRRWATCQSAINIECRLSGMSRPDSARITNTAR